MGETKDFQTTIEHGINVRVHVRVPQCLSEGCEIRAVTLPGDPDEQDIYDLLSDRTVERLHFRAERFLVALSMLGGHGDAMDLVRAQIDKEDVQ